MFAQEGQQLTVKDKAKESEYSAISVLETDVEAQKRNTGSKLSAKKEA